MKNLLVFVLVCGGGALTSAGLTLDVRDVVLPWGTFTVGIVSDDGLQYDCYLMVEDNDVGISGHV